MSKKLTTEEFIQKARSVHGNKYDYSLTEYVGNKNNAKIICSEHGVFEQAPSNHLKGSGCPKCVGCVKKTTENFIEEAVSVHGNKYDYSLVEYAAAKKKVKIICQEHGVFEQIAKRHLLGCGCPKCSGNIKKTTENFIEEAVSVHGNKYDYSLVEYAAAKKKVKIICQEHGVFEQIANQHLQGAGCLKCAINAKKSTTDEFIKKAINVHDDKYDYSLVEYATTKKKVKIICQEHGVFEQIANQHLQGAGCPKCRESKGEKFIRKLLEKKCIYFQPQKKFDTCVYKRNLYYDFFIPSKNILIEYNGVQHYESIPNMGGEKEFELRKLRDKIKKRWARENGYKLLTFPYTEDFDTIKKVIERHL